MRLRMGMPVRASDGPFGELADIVVDPQLRKVTHVVVRPVNQQHLSRLVPMWLVSVADSANGAPATLTISLDLARVRQLQRAAFSDFVSPEHPLDLGDRWDIGSEDVVAFPYWHADELAVHADNASEHSFDPVPKSECEIRRTSAVISSDNKTVGHVEGLMAEGENLTGVVVRTGVRGLHHEVLVPMGMVESVETDRIMVAVTRHEFGELPRADDFGEPIVERPPTEGVRQSLGRAVHRVRRWCARVTNHG